MVRENDYVLVHYTGTFEDGEIFDTSIDREPLEFRVGSGDVIPGFDQAVMGMKINEEKDFVVKPDEGYGERDDKMTYRFPSDEIKSHFEPEVGLTIGLELEDGNRVPAIITEVTEKEVVVDLNHPLAGRTLHFHIQLLEINAEAKYKHSCSSDGCSSGCCDSGSGCSC
jgi:peptidylprolyl isomerase